MTYAIVNINSNEVDIVTSLSRVRLPNGETVFNPPVGYEWPPQYDDEDSDTVLYRIYALVIVNVGSGPRLVSETAPVFDPQAGTVTVIRTFAPAIPRVIPPALEDIPPSVTTVADLRAALNLTLAHLRGD